MVRLLLLTLGLAACMAGQIRWKCDPKDGKFVVTPCSTCKKFYCWDGEIFSDEEGYTPPPSSVLAYWEEVHRKSQQIREDIDRRGKELKQQFEKAQQDGARLNQERMQAHKEYMDDLNRRIAQSRAGSGTTRSVSTTAQRAAPRDIVVGDARPAASSGGAAAIPARAVPRGVVVDRAEPSASGPRLAPISRAQASGVQTGMNRAAVEELLGKQHSAISIPEDEGLVETLSYALDDGATVRVKMVQGKVVSVKIPD